MFRFTIRVLALGIGVVLGASLLAEDKIKSPAIEVGRPVAEMTAALRAHEIEWRVGAFAETSVSHNPDSADGFFNLGEEMLARVYYSQSRKVITGMSVVVHPKGEGRRTHRTFDVKRIQIEDDGSFSVQFLPERKNTPNLSITPQFPSRSP